MLKRIISVFVAAVMIFTVFSAAAFACDTPAENFKNKYPYVFVHGFNGWGGGEGINRTVSYWGATTGDLMAYLTRSGYECYAASVGPISSAWDRACELYAQLTGGTVDYGEAHSREHNHLRYGRTYDKPLFEGWGEKDSAGNIKKVNLIGHSFGGTTIRLLTYLLTYGCEEEIKAGGDTVSGLFTGGKENYVESVTTLCTPHNSSSVYRLVLVSHLYEMTLFFSSLYCATLGRSPLNGTLVDFHLEQFGLTNTPGKCDADWYIRSIIRFLENSDDTCEYDLLPENADKLNDMIEISPNVYYFSYAFDCTKKDELTGLYFPTADANPVIAPLGLWLCHHLDFVNEKTGQVYDETWKPNDMLCNTVSEMYPFDEPHTEYDSSVTPERGIWYVMPVQHGDHGQAVGLLNSRRETRAFYDGLAEMLLSLR